MMLIMSLTSPYTETDRLLEMKFSGLDYSGINLSYLPGIVCQVRFRPIECLIVPSASETAVCCGFTAVLVKGMGVFSR